MTVVSKGICKEVVDVKEQKTNDQVSDHKFNEAEE
jgi:hypothetical protein